MTEKKGIIVLDLILVSFVLLISLAFSSVIAQNPTPIISVLPARTQGTFMSQDGMNTTEIIANEINNTFSKLEYCEFRDVEDGVTNPGVLTSISFEVIGTSGTSALNLNALLTNSDFEIITETEIKNGKCIIGEVTGEQLTHTPTVTPSPAVSPVLTPMPISQAQETTTKPEEKTEVPGFEAPLAIAAIALIALWFVRKRM